MHQFGPKMARFFPIPSARLKFSVCAVGSCVAKDSEEATGVEEVRIVLAPRVAKRICHDSPENSPASCRRRTTSTTSCCKSSRAAILMWIRPPKPSRPFQKPSRFKRTRLLRPRRCVAINDMSHSSSLCILSQVLGVRTANGGCAGNSRDKLGYLRRIPS